MHQEPIKQDSQILSRILQTIKQQGTMKKTLAEYLSYKGKTSSKIISLSHALEGKQGITLENINKIAEFYRYPVGYFLFGNKDSQVISIHEEKIIQYLIDFFEYQKTLPKSERVAKYTLGALIGYGSDKTSQLNTINDIIIKKKRRLRINDLFIIADFLHLSIEDFLHRVS